MPARDKYQSDSPYAMPKVGDESRGVTKTPTNFVPGQM